MPYVFVYVHYSVRIVTYTYALCIGKAKRRKMQTVDHPSCASTVSSPKKIYPIVTPDDRFVKRGVAAARTKHIPPREHPSRRRTSRIEATARPTSTSSLHSPRRPNGRTAVARVPHDVRAHVRRREVRKSRVRRDVGRQHAAMGSGRLLHHAKQEDTHRPPSGAKIRTFNSPVPSRFAHMMRIG